MGKPGVTIHVTAKSRNATTPMFSSQVISFGCFQHKYNKHIIAQQTLLFEMWLSDRFFLINFVFPSFFSSDPILTLLPFEFTFPRFTLHCSSKELLGILLKSFAC